MADAIKVEHVGKRYRLGQGSSRYLSLRDSLMSSLSRRRSDPQSDPVVWALRDLTLTVSQGEAVGVIGRNGVGKTTLLKILARITEPTTGVARTRGRVGALLEVGTGFHPELTGRDNIYLNGAVLGMSRKDIRRRFDEIVSFAEVDRFVDTPLKRYSSGMYMRLAFAVAAHVEPEILVVDEVLAVGDVAFQKKCLGKMEDAAAEGRTVVFVSHNMSAVESLCSRTVWLDAGQIMEEGSPRKVVSNYLQTSIHGVTEQVWDNPVTAPGNEKVRLRSARVRAATTSGSEILTIRTPFVLEFEYWNLRPGARLNLSLHVYNEQGVMVFNAAPMPETAWYGRSFPVGLFRDCCHVPGDLLNDGMYRLELLVVENEALVVYRKEDILVFHLQDTTDMRGAWYDKWLGAVRPMLDWTTELMEAGVPTLSPWSSTRNSQLRG